MMQEMSDIDIRERKAEIARALADVRREIRAALLAAARPEDSLTLIAVTKNFPAGDIRALYELGERHFGENREQEAHAKYEELHTELSDAHWHFQGQIQSRKIPRIASWASYVHSLDDLAHAAKFATQPKIPEFFLQINLEPERTDRGGVTLEDATDFCRQLPPAASQRLVGLMTVAPLERDPDDAFSEVRNLRDELVTTWPQLKSLSMGMSSDFESAIRNGATHIRVGSSILGSRTQLA
jgi:hypothetical protein